MNPWAAASLAGLAGTVALAAYVVVRVPRTPTRLPFVLLVAAFGIWDLGEAVVRLSPTADLAALLPWIRFEWVGVSLTSGTFLHFSLNLASGRPLRDRPWAIPIVYAATGFLGAFVVGTDVIVSGVDLSGPTGPVVNVGAGYPPAALWYEAWFVSAFVVLFQAYWRGESPGFRRRVRSLLAVLSTAGLLASVTEVFWPILTDSPGNLGLVSIYMLAITVGASAAEVRYHFLEVPAVTEAAPPRPRPLLPPGAAYLVLEKTREPAFSAFRELVSVTPGLCLTGVYPRKVQRRFGLERTPILWLTNAEESERSARPRALEFEVLHAVSRFVRGNPATVVLVDDVDLLVRTVGFEAVARFLHRLNNLSTGRGSTTIAALDPDALPADQVTLLRGLFDVVREFPPPVSFLEATLPSEPAAVLVEGDAEAALSLYETIATEGRGVVVTTKHPARIRGRLGASAPILWVASGGEAITADAHPVAIDLEAGSLATSLLRDRERPVVFVADIEQLRLFAPFPRVVEFVKGLIDQVAIRDGVLLASVEPKGIEAQELACLRRRFDVVRKL